MTTYLIPQPVQAAFRELMMLDLIKFDHAGQTQEITISLVLEKLMELYETAKKETQK